MAVIAALLVVLGISLNRPEKVVEVVKHKTDTLTVTKTDTVTITDVKYVTKKQVDTVYIPSNGQDEIPVPMSNYRFFQSGLYDITAYGFNVSLSNVTVFPKTEYKTITETIEKEIVLRQWDFYLGGGIWRYKDEWIPNIGCMVKTPKNFLFGANLGYYNKSLIVGGTVHYKITHNK